MAQHVALNPHTSAGFDVRAQGVALGLHSDQMVLQGGKLAFQRVNPFFQDFDLLLLQPQLGVAFPKIRDEVSRRERRLLSRSIPCVDP